MGPGASTSSISWRSGSAYGPDRAEIGCRAITPDQRARQVRCGTPRGVVVERSRTSRSDDAPYCPTSRTLHIGAGSLTRKQHARLHEVFPAKDHADVDATWEIRQCTVATYRLQRALSDHRHTRTGSNQPGRGDRFRGPEAYVRSKFGVHAGGKARVTPSGVVSDLQPFRLSNGDEVSEPA